MIKFFRNIRQNLLSSGSTSRYIKYALGEIVLVVIGILIALEINNWNENKKQLALEESYYCRILDDFELDRQLINSSSIELNSKIDSAKQLLQYMHQGNKDLNTYMNKWVKVQRFDVFVPRTIAFKDLMSSGNLNILKDIELKNNLSQYYANLENILHQIHQNREEIANRGLSYDINGFGFKEIDYLKTALGDKIYSLLPKPTWLDNTEHPYFKKMENDIVLIITLSDRQKQHYKAIIETMEEPYQQLRKKCQNETRK